VVPCGGQPRHPYGGGVEMATRFGPLLGIWTGAERHQETPGGPVTTARASLVLRLDVAATVVVQDYRRVHADGSELTGHGVFLAEPGGTDLLWWFFDSTGRVPTPARGSGREGELVLESVTADGPARHHFHAADDRLDYRVDVRVGGATERLPLLTGSYRRITGH